MHVAVMATLTKIPKAVSVCKVKCHRGLSKSGLRDGTVFFSFNFFDLCICQTSGRCAVGGMSSSATWGFGFFFGPPSR